MEWNGMEWNGMEWNGVRQQVYARDARHQKGADQHARSREQQALRELLDRDVHVEPHRVAEEQDRQEEV